MRCLVARSSLDEFAPEAIRKAWKRRWLNRIRWWFVRAKFWIKIENVMAKHTGAITIVVTQDHYDHWRKRHGKG